MRPVTQYSLLLDSKAVGEFEWLSGRKPELHFHAEGRDGLVRLERLRPFILAGGFETPAPGIVGILHVGSAGQGLVEVGGVQFLRRTAPTGSTTVRDHAGTVVLRSPASADKRIVAFDRATSRLEIPGLLELTLVEVFCAIYPGLHMIRAMMSAWVPLPRLGEPLASLPAVQGLGLDSGGGPPTPTSTESEDT